MSFERKFLENGKKNEKYVDLCDEDQPIAGQKFACISFVSPEKIIKKREVYLFDQFVKQWEFSKSMERYFDFIHFISYKYNLKVEGLIDDFNEFVKEETSKLRKSGIEDDYKNFIDKHEDKLNEQFSREHAFQTSIRGLKVRGSFSTQEEAEMKCKSLREKDPNHDIYVGPVGVWIPWDPDAYKTGRVEYLEEELNALHKEKMKNEELAKKNFEERVRETKKKAIMENIEKAQKSGNVLTQTIDEEGNLIGVKEKIDFDEREVAEVESTKLHNELFIQSVREKANENINATS
jgi:vacuolar-type H+-ATPase subunit I/STV1